MRLVLDSNLFISSLITVDTPPDLLCRQWRVGNFDLITSREQIAEILRVTGYAKLQKYFTPAQAADLLKDLHYFSEVVTLRDVPTISQDPADNLIIATALAGNANYLVTSEWFGKQSYFSCENSRNPVGWALPTKTWMWWAVPYLHNLKFFTLSFRIAIDACFHLFLTV